VSAAPAAGVSGVGGDRGLLSVDGTGERGFGRGGV